MSTIKLITYINAPREVCFNLSRSVELHKLSTSKTKEEVIAGRTSGLFEYGDTVTWRAKHFGVYQTLQMQISGMKEPLYFEDKMVKGIFKSICHQHFFIEHNGITTMQDVFRYRPPFSIVGAIFNLLILKNYMRRLLLERNKVIKDYAETGKWQEICRAPKLVSL